MDLYCSHATASSAAGEPRRSGRVKLSRNVLSGGAGSAFPAGSFSTPGPNASMTGSIARRSNAGVGLDGVVRRPEIAVRPSKYHGDQFSQSFHVRSVPNAARARVPEGSKFVDAMAT